MTDQPSLQQLEDWFSQARLSTYRGASDPAALYAWSARLGVAVFELIGHTEVLLRNAIHARLAANSGSLNWYDDPFYHFNSQTLQDINQAKARATRSGHTPTPDRVVSELTLGFWRYLLSSTYQTTIWPSASHAFQGLPSRQRDRSTIEQEVLSLVSTRNRLAHQEPVFMLSPHLLEDDIILLASHINPQAATWIKSISRVSSVLAERPSVIRTIYTYVVYKTHQQNIRYE